MQYRASARWGRMEMVGRHRRRTPAVGLPAYARRFRSVLRHPESGRVVECRGRGADYAWRKLQFCLRTSLQRCHACQWMLRGLQNCGRGAAGGTASRGSCGGTRGWSRQRSKKSCRAAPCTWGSTECGPRGMRWWVTGRNASAEGLGARTKWGAWEAVVICEERRGSRLAGTHNQTKPVDLEYKRCRCASHRKTSQTAAAGMYWGPA